MPFAVVDKLSIGAADVNEDRAGQHDVLAWVIDGATDIGTEPLAGSATDADWIAGEIDRWLADPGTALPAVLGELPVALATEMARRFAAVRRRAPADRFEYPCAAGVVVRDSGARLDYVSVGDCTILAREGGRAIRVGADARDPGDRWLANAVQAFQTTSQTADAAEQRSHVWPAVRAHRNRLNLPDGFGVLSIVPPPAAFVRSGSMAALPGSHVLLASDGLMRLVDVYHDVDDAALLDTACRDGLSALGRRLRAIEAADADNRKHPRAKTRDDATGLLLRIL